jgi:hypothetical protein
MKQKVFEHRPRVFWQKKKTFHPQHHGVLAKKENDSPSTSYRYLEPGTFQSLQQTEPPISLLNVTSSSAAAAMVRGSAAALSVLLAVLAGG